MSGRFMKIVIPFAALTIMTSQLAGCASADGAQSAADVIDQNDSSTGVIEVKDEEKQPLSGDALIKYFQLTHDSCGALDSASQEEQLNFELDMLVSFCDTDGEKLPADYAEQYKSWRPADQQAPEIPLQSNTQQSGGNTQNTTQPGNQQQDQSGGQPTSSTVASPDDLWTDPYAGMTPEEKAAQQAADRQATQDAIDQTQGSMHD